MVFAFALVLVAIFRSTHTNVATMSRRDAPLSPTVADIAKNSSTPTILAVSTRGPSDDPSKKMMPIKGKPKSFPPLSSLVDAGLNGIPSGIRRDADVSWLLDWAVVGFPKCGTTTLMQSLNTPYDAAVVQKERCGLGNNDVAKLVWHLENDPFPKDPTIKRGIKCPKDLESKYTLINLAKYFPKTKIIVTVRHPILWFQSFYNFRAKNIFPRKMPPTTRAINGLQACRRSTDVCTYRANFHKFLARMGKTPLSSQEEMELLQPGWNMDEVVRSNAKVFLMHVSQLGDKNETRLNQFREDLRWFAGLDGEIRLESGKIVAEQVIQPEARRRMIDICSHKHDEVRQVLMKQARSASKWILRYFLSSPEVVVSSREHFVQLVRLWEFDPCDSDAFVKHNMTRW